MHALTNSINRAFQRPCFFNTIPLCMVYAIFKIHSNKLGQWFEWCNKINTIYYQEALSTLAEENIVMESFCNFRIGNDWYAFGCVVAEETKQPLPSNKDKKINLEHTRNKKECLELISKGNSAYFLKI